MVSRPILNRRLTDGRLADRPKKARLISRGLQGLIVMLDHGLMNERLKGQRYLEETRYENEVVNSTKPRNLGRFSPGFLIYLNTGREILSLSLT